MLSTLSAYLEKLKNKIVVFSYYNSGTSDSQVNVKGKEIKILKCN